MAIYCAASGNIEVSGLKNGPMLMSGDFSDAVYCSRNICCYIRYVVCGRNDSSTASFLFGNIFIYQILATKSLKKESMKVYKKLKEGDLLGARKEVSYLVGRDTENLDESEVAKADVENNRPKIRQMGMIATECLFIALGARRFGFAYKAVNTS